MPEPVFLAIRPAEVGEPYRVFISSADQARSARTRLRRLIVDVINPLLVESKAGFTLFPDMWEDTPAMRVPDGGNVNDLFVRRAMQSHMTIVVLVDELRAGTREELEAVLDLGHVELCVLRFTERTEEAARADELGDYLAGIQHRLLYVLKVGGVDSDAAWLSLVSQLLALVLSILFRRPVTEYREVRFSDAG